MRSSTGRWVSGDDFFDREAELRILESRVRDRNHVLLTGQRRMGKTSILRELGRRLEADGWIFLFVDVEGATCAEDAIAYIARAVHPVRAVASRFAMEILAEAATRDVFTPGARRSLEWLYANVVGDAPERIADALDVLVHDGYVEAGPDGHRFPSRLLKDWWSARFRDHHVPLERRRADDGLGGQVQ